MPCGSVVYDGGAGHALPLGKLTFQLGDAFLGVVLVHQLMVALIAFGVGRVMVVPSAAVGS
jgi:hypothetical protein